MLLFPTRATAAHGFLTALVVAAALWRAVGFIGLAPSVKLLWNQTTVVPRDAPLKPGVDPQADARLVQSVAVNANRALQQFLELCAMSFALILAPAALSALAAPAPRSLRQRFSLPAIAGATALATSVLASVAGRHVKTLSRPLDLGAGSLDLPLLTAAWIGSTQRATYLLVATLASAASLCLALAGLSFRQWYLSLGRQRL
jgi:hypothetical protein